MYALTIHYNDRGPFIITARDRGQLFARVHTTVDDWLLLIVQAGSRGSRRDYFLDTVGPGDSLRFRYDVTTEEVPETIEALPLCSRVESSCRLRDGHRIGLDVLYDGWKGIRLSHPEGGGFTLMLGTIPRDHARVFIMAGNESERWQWQLPDLYSGQSIGFEVVETTGCSPFPKVTKAD